MRRPTKLRTGALIWAVALSCILTLASPASAGWDPAVFGKLLGEAEQAYVEGEWADAESRYAVLRSMLEDALLDDALPDEHRARALQTLLVIDYQLGRCHQKTDNCVSAAEVYRDTLESVGEDQALRVKLLVRIAESEVCVAGQAVGAADMGGAQRALDAAGRHLADATLVPLGEVLPASQVAELQTVLEETTARRETLQRQRHARLVAGAEAAIATGDCVIAETQLRSLAAEGVDAAEQARLGAQLDALCAPPPPQDETTSVAPFVVAGLGVASLATVAVLEGLAAGTVDDFSAARTDCAAGVATRCKDTLDLRNDLETQQIVTGALVGVGVAALAGGLLWWWLDSPENPEPSAALLPSVLDDGVATTLFVRW